MHVYTKIYTNIAKYMFLLNNNVFIFFHKNFLLIYILFSKLLKILQEWRFTRTHVKRNNPKIINFQASKTSQTTNAINLIVCIVL